MRTAEEHYQKREKRYLTLHNKQSRSADRISNLRLLVSLAGLALSAVVFYQTANYYVLGGLLLATLAGFIYLVVMHNRILRNKKYSALLAGINQSSLKRLVGEWKAFADLGEDFKDDNHRYAGDLDIFGQGSLFQWVNTAITFSGRKELAKRLTELPLGAVEIREGQEAVNELAGRLAWRQKFMAEAMVAGGASLDPENLLRWATSQNRFYRKAWMKLLLRLLPALTIILLILYFSPLRISFFWPLAGLVLQGLMLYISGKPRNQILNSVYRYESTIRAYYEMLKRFENTSFSSGLLSKLKRSLRNRQNMPAFRQIDRLAKIVEAISNRNNALFALVNILTLWDFQCMIRLEDWKQKSGRFLRTWLSVLGQLEALSSLAVIRHDNPAWAVPHIVQDKPGISATGMGHPLLTKNRVCNDLKLGYPAGILLITGSNMSGKSTWLRTTGINLVLAYAGAPVCAEEFHCSVMNIYTCMRVGDNLEKNISSFYAELLRIKQIVQAAKEEGQLFFLLDEIFKGTNSADRHVGAKVVILQFGKQKALGMVSTHDLDLGELEGESGGKIKNFHFREGYRDNEIYFDYKLQPGLSTTRNALFLIKMAGIEVDV